MYSWRSIKIAWLAHGEVLSQIQCQQQVSAPFQPFTAGHFSGRHRVKSGDGRELWKARLHNQFLLSALTALYYLPLSFSFLLIIVNSDWNCNSGSTLKKNSSIIALCLSIWRNKWICYLRDMVTVWKWLELPVIHMNLWPWKLLCNSCSLYLFWEESSEDN